MASPSTNCPVQQAAVRALRREFAAGEDAEKVEAYEQGVMGLKASYDTFNHLKRIPPARSGAAFHTTHLPTHVFAVCCCSLGSLAIQGGTFGSR